MRRPFFVKNSYCKTLARYPESDAWRRPYKVISIVSARKYSLRVRDDFSAVSMRRREGILLR